MTWTDEKIKKLKKLWQKGCSTVEIAKELGISKNAVVGKVHRLELEARPSPIKKKAKKVVEHNSSKQQFTGLMDLKINSCRWPIGDPEEEGFHFCGKEASTGKPYCPEHCKIAYTSLKELTLQNAKAKKEKQEQEELALKEQAQNQQDTLVEEKVASDEIPDLMPIKGKRSEASKRKVTKLKLQIDAEAEQKKQAKKK